MIPRATLVGLSLAFLSGCAGSPSLVERSILASVPPAYSQHRGGIDAAPNADAVKSALQFGAASKESPDTLEYAYLYKTAKSGLSTDAIYIKVETPLYLIARHARDAAREYRAADPAFIDYARALGAVRVSVSQQFLSSVTWRAYAFNRQLILLRDGERVEPLREIAAWKNQSPFLDVASPVMAAALASIDETAARYALMAGARTASAKSVSLSEADAVFPIEELRKPGNYEIVFREPQAQLLGGVSTAEVRLPISFEKFR